MLDTVQQADAPAIYPTANTIMAAWVSADETDTYHTLTDIHQAEPVRLPVLTQFPQDHQFVQAGRDRLHLLWLDADPDRPADGKRLWALNIGTDSTAERGAFITHDSRTYHYSVIPNPDGSMWAFMSAAPAAEPTLYAQYFDANTRPREAVRLTGGVDWPVAQHQPDGTIRLTWLSAPGQMMTQATFDVTTETLGPVQPLGPSPALAVGDRISGFHRVGPVAFWNITRAGGTSETWVAARATDGTWPRPERLGIVLRANQRLETGYQGAGALPAEAGTLWAAWAQPGQPTGDYLPVAVQIGSELGIIYFQQGRVVGYESVTTLDDLGLIGQLSFTSDQRGDLYLAWAQPTRQGYARLHLATTR